MIDRLVRSWQQAPHFVQMIDIDATAVKAALAAAKAAGSTITLNDFLIEACVLAVQAEPSVNAHIRGTRLVTHGQIVISLAVDTARGLRTPKIPIADPSLDAIARQRVQAIAAIQQGSVLPDQDHPAVVTISNLGKFGIKAGTPVLNLDEPVLVFAGAIEDRVVAIDGAVVVRPYMTLSIAYDHRVVDGMQAARFTSAIKARLENTGVGQ
ncbi:2-oxo acid dehydrogenase subunit E2 [Sphingobium sp. CR2-8]|uniref:2-oxo acid dehydrogenase subunit E2 n=1 Tax=Sphingobium sp. CR2-8 TaxID=1306534 RepID=UPI002DBD3A91|nr:2-oxo acid dehydrogenase subunit E2 [Sphingobium sp. CR2-8]MEC3909395.1 2-oxo acid dehydrogenase subunit E2 [Sphingobium sp. CR2-8]